MSAEDLRAVVINEVFSPNPDELARYERLIAAVDRARASGAGAVTFEGAMVDEACLPRALVRARPTAALAGQTPPNTKFR
ncbi:hypothetical protein [Nonomuraea jiangxiensis]|uniref:Citrate lyase subunit beta / citryl-CoA lyase n=1 Tax=Nonomuraea jiangxiensis TaxID=633440 RepID=A0A1G8J8R7_9ACTN|nr:hypothetical protein [Nonomuraea jiangxiensis]SDI27654.1 hypothetical protein SAMN05421869_10516 [Nonomuraea jiangxiensis]